MYLYILGRVTRIKDLNRSQAVVTSTAVSHGVTFVVAGFMMLVMLGMAAKKLSRVQKPCW